MYHMIICGWCNGRGFDIVVEDGSMFQYTCEYCKGAGRKIVFPPEGLGDGQQDKDKTDTEEGNEE
jgi:DnaJ-class molecular chaperone